jgi:hypothetical protein
MMDYCLLTPMKSLPLSRTKGQKTQQRDTANLFEKTGFHQAIEAGCL